MFTFAADTSTYYRLDRFPDFYRCWLTLEFLDGDEVTRTAASPELTGTNAASRLLAVTATAPEGTTGVRGVVSAQNKYWNPLENRATLEDTRLLKLDGPRGEQVAVAVDTPLPQAEGQRTANLTVTSDWPDDTAVAVTASRGAVPETVLLSDGQAEVRVEYEPTDVGGAEVAVALPGDEAEVRFDDPRAATLVIDDVRADGRSTPVLVRLTRDGQMLPGRYQETVPGIYVTLPWRVDIGPGTWELAISRGPEFEAHRQTIDASSGDTIELGELELTRRADMPDRGWYGGDGDGDVYHGERIYTDVNAGTAAKIGQAMGLAWIGVGNWGEPSPGTWGEARAAMDELGHEQFLFTWTEERPKGRDGHACFIGMERPDDDRFGFGWLGLGDVGRVLRNFEALHAIRASGGATFANHPLRWWTSGDRFRTNMYSSLAFDLCAAGQLDGFNINEDEQAPQVWSMLLDKGYRVAATAGADFCLDRPSGPPPGKNRMYTLCPDGMSPKALADAVRNGHTIVSTGPTLVADIDGRPPGTTLEAGESYEIHAEAWARGDQPDQLQRLELWAHGEVVASRELDDGAQAADTTFTWQPEGEWDWVAVRAVSQGGWAMTSAFYAAGEDWQEPQPVQCEVTLEVTGLSEAERAETVVQIWDNVPALTTSQQLDEVTLTNGETVRAPVTATLVVIAPDGSRETVSVYDAIGVQPLVDEISSGEREDKPLHEWDTYQRMLDHCREATARVAF